MIFPFFVHRGPTANKDRWASAQHWPLPARLSVVTIQLVSAMANDYVSGRHADALQMKKWISPEDFAPSRGREAVRLYEHQHHLV
ncbi:hypothetical protein [Corynebacterium pyruviciproducens]|uniref:hypothetical protein n=1 Tax=Corynebacterium pyruviciproducens TaxID=598660 RepID=UPI002549FE91|nr:hypothetical protein [Corynebacterium pyruviciproducens]